MASIIVRYYSRDLIVSSECDLLWALRTASTPLLTDRIGRDHKAGRLRQRHSRAPVLLVHFVIFRPISMYDVSPEAFEPARQGLANQRIPVFQTASQVELMQTVS